MDPTQSRKIVRTLTKQAQYLSVDPTTGNGSAFQHDDASISSFTRLASAADADGFQPPVLGTGVGTSERTVRVTPPAVKADSTGTETTGIGPDGAGE